MNDTLVRLIGWTATVLYAELCVFDRWRWLKRHLLRGHLRTLDAGCGSGLFTMYASRMGNEAVGIDLDEYHCQLAQQRASILRMCNVQFIQADLRDLDKFAGKLGDVFDQIICLETIEHVKNDTKLVTSLSGLLKPHGRLYLTTPFRNCRPLFGDKLSEYEDGGHVRWGYTHDEVRELFGQCGLDVLEEQYISGFVSHRLTDLMMVLTRITFQ